MEPDVAAPPSTRRTFTVNCEAEMAEAEGNQALVLAVTSPVILGAAENAGEKVTTCEPVSEAATVTITDPNCGRSPRPSQLTRHRRVHRSARH